ncbi:GNAT family N-acetyltransferase [Nonomuraea bangladeshensis]
MDAPLETSRLVLRPFTAADAEQLIALHNDAEVMRHLNGGKPVPRERILGETLPRFVRGGFLAAVEKASGGFIGWFHLRPPEGGPADELELGYRLHRAAWGKGYATEGSLALIDRAFDELGARRGVRADDGGQRAVAAGHGEVRDAARADVLRGLAGPDRGRGAGRGRVRTTPRTPAPCRPLTTPPP